MASPKRRGDENDEVVKCLSMQVSAEEKVNAILVILASRADLTPRKTAVLGITTTQASTLKTMDINVFSDMLGVDFNLPQVGENCITWDLPHAPQSNLSDDAGMLSSYMMKWYANGL
jgi:hypothetical protein